MKTKELIKKVEHHGLVVEHDYGLNNIVVFAEYNGEEYVVARVSETKRYSLTTNYSHFLYTLDAEQQDRLFNLLSIYASTPVEERQEEKKYYIVMQEIDTLHKFLNLNKRNKTTILSTRSETLEYKTQFTKSEIEQYGLQKFTNNELFELVEVNDD
ncbi:hypothetical protein KFV08_07855 [Macrococcoides canis]|uniref:hypothetical protein n=1 Tax=Macrococcoides canis TaxID=1855823 RepID=UPI00207C3B8A|nr:hypothetical protein [Macrococcus canis]MCO4095731.1 hypothetical protein [Macrococcus canis]UTH08440.1 hypothetical protein KFV08_07855 [Macrococcus canis]